MTEKDLSLVSMRGSGVMRLGFHRLLESSAQYEDMARDCCELKGCAVISEVESFLLSLAVSLSKPVCVCDL